MNDGSGRELKFELSNFSQYNKCVMTRDTLDTPMQD